MYMQNDRLVMTSVLSGVHEYSHSWYCFYHTHAHPLIYVQGFIRLQVYLYSPESSPSPYPADLPQDVRSLTGFNARV